MIFTRQNWATPEYHLIQAFDLCSVLCAESCPRLSSTSSRTFRKRISARSGWPEGARYCEKEGQRSGGIYLDQAERPSWAAPGGRNTLGSSPLRQRPFSFWIMPLVFSRLDEDSRLLHFALIAARASRVKALKGDSRSCRQDQCVTASYRQTWPAARRHAAGSN